MSHVPPSQESLENEDHIIEDHNTEDHIIEDHTKLIFCDR
jgi:hypothetical protein